ncbi:hypothetical protein JRQ81_007485 [Phrynocephalus forsythii]|uniref:Protein FAM26F n=1 Tax=Phrynocephalus forsythii TaxID=171643 RepID=A0A9Q1B6L4_9SAUR|nr:hypothetical protein JRQ81_007485 [Phrynocephalus forsythii]
MKKVGTMLNFFLSHQKVLGYGAVSLLTIGSERIFSVAVFKCPCNSWNMLYGAVFLLVPALVLFLLGVLLKTQSWKVLTGCCAPSRMGQCPTGSRFCHYLQVLWLVAASAAVAPFTWIAVALLGGSFYECAVTGSTHFQQKMCQGKMGDPRKECLEMVLQVPCGLSSATPSEMQNMLVNLRAQSQVIGWILIASVFTLVLVGTCISRCRSPVSMLQLAFWKIYMEKESQLFEAKAEEHAAKLAERNLKCFFDSTELEPFQTPSPKAWNGISSLFAFNPEQHYYSMIHKYVTCKSKSGSIKSTEGDAFHLSLGFVDGAGGVVIGWILIASVFTLVLVGTCISRCRSPVSMLQLAFWKIYMEKESQLFEAKAEEHAAKLAERNLKCFFDSTELEPFQTPSPKAWNGISSLFAFNPEQHYYSMIHKYVTCKSKSGSIKSTEGDAFHLSLGFVDGAGGVVTEPAL